MPKKEKRYILKSATLTQKNINKINEKAKELQITFSEMLRRIIEEY